MKRDLDLVRKILLACEADPNGDAPNQEIEGYTEEQFGFHVYLMIQAGLLEGTDISHDGSNSPIGFARAMTWQGYEFLEASRDESRWEKARNFSKSAGGLTFDVLKATLVGLASAAVQKAMGLP